VKRPKRKTRSGPVAGLEFNIIWSTSSGLDTSSSAVVSTTEPHGGAGVSPIDLSYVTTTIGVSSSSGEATPSKNGVVSTTKPHGGAGVSLIELSHAFNNIGSSSSSHQDAPSNSNIVVLATIPHGSAGVSVHELSPAVNNESNMHLATNTATHAFDTSTPHTKNGGSGDELPSNAVHDDASMLASHDAVMQFCYKHRPMFLIEKKMAV
jgi:hypothetical protein